MKLYCPICDGVLTRQERTYRCEKNHCFDIARQGYVNLLPVQQKHSLHPGDTRQQVLARRSFLEGGFYSPIARAVCRIAREFGCHGPVLDVGCGEGYYSHQLKMALDCELTGLDISKEAVRWAAGLYKDCSWVCATAAHLPVEPRSVGLLTSLFSVTLPEEFRRALTEDGMFLQVLAGPDHLLGLKSLIYPTLTEKEKDSVPALPGFALVHSERVSFSFTVEGDQVGNLLSMTPHVYRIGPEGAKRLAATKTLTDRASCIVNLYRPLHLGESLVK